MFSDGVIAYKTNQCGNNIYLHLMDNLNVIVIILYKIILQVELH